MTWSPARTSCGGCSAYCWVDRRAERRPPNWPLPLTSAASKNVSGYHDYVATGGSHGSRRVSRHACSRCRARCESDLPSPDCFESRRAQLRYRRTQRAGVAHRTSPDRVERLHDTGRPQVAGRHKGSGRLRRRRAGRSLHRRCEGLARRRDHRRRRPAADLSRPRRCHRSIRQSEPSRRRVPEGSVRDRASGRRDPCARGVHESHRRARHDQRGRNPVSPRRREVHQPAT